MNLKPDQIYTATERAALKLRCPECRAALAITWRRTKVTGRSEDLYRIAKTSCTNHCLYDTGDIIDG